MIKKLRIFAILFALIITFQFSTVSAYAWGDSNDGRPDYTIDEINNGALEDRIVFNSISDSIIGHEKNFVGAIFADEDKYPRTTWYADEIEAVDGEDYYIRIYFHNNSPLGYDAVAEDTTVYFSLPTTSDAEQTVVGYISSSNADPTRYWDEVDFVSDSIPFHLEYYENSAILNNNFSDGIQLTDDIISSAGALVGYDALDGKIPGCYEYSGVVVIRVKVVYDYAFTTETKVRRLGDTDWQDEISAKAGETLEFKTVYENTSDYTQSNVRASNTLSEYLEYEEGSACLYNDDNAEGTAIADSVVTAEGMDIGDYTAGESASVIFRAKVADTGSDENVLTNRGCVEVGSTVKQSDVSVTINNLRLPLAILLAALCVAAAISIVLTIWRIIQFRRGKSMIR